MGICIAESRCVTRVTRQTGKLNERSRTTTSRSQQQICTESKFTATAGIRTCDFGMLAHLSAHSAKSHPMVTMVTFLIKKLYQSVQSSPFHF
jgi:hypothetical protein